MTEAESAGHPLGRLGEAESAGDALGPATRLRGRLAVPSDKSIAHRALIANAIAGPGEARVVVRSPGADVRSTAAALTSAGAAVSSARATDGETETFVVAGPGGPGGHGSPDRPAAAARIDCGNSGTTMRLLTGVLAAGAVTGHASVLVGDGSLMRRPMERVALPLRAMGADVRTSDGRPPVEVRPGRPLRAMEHHLPVASAQVVGAVCFAALAAEGPTRITTPGPTRDHTERLLAWMGAPVARHGHTTSVDGPAQLRPRSLVVPGDISSAAAWLVAATIHPDAELVLVDVGINPSRAALIEALHEMGASIEIHPRGEDGPEPSADITVRSAGRLRPLSIGGSRVAELIDELPLLGVAMAACEAPSELRDASELRVKESDRISTMVRNLERIGARVDERADGWRVARGRPAAAAIETQGDHRIAIAFAVAALTGLASSVRLDDRDCVAVSYPTFWAHVAAVTGVASPGTGVASPGAAHAAGAAA